jgi:hypothetical protein
MIQTGCVSDPADVVFLLDRSGSVGKSAFQTELQFIAEFAKHYVIGPRNVQIGVLSPAAVVKLFSLTNFNAVDVCVPLKIYFIFISFFSNSLIS